MSTRKKTAKHKPKSSVTVFLDLVSKPSDHEDVTYDISFKRKESRSSIESPERNSNQKSFFHEAKVEFSKKNFLETAFRPNPKCRDRGSVGFEMQVEVRGKSLEVLIDTIMPISSRSTFSFCSKIPSSLETDAAATASKKSSEAVSPLILQHRVLSSTAKVMLMHYLNIRIISSVEPPSASPCQWIHRVGKKKINIYSSMISGSLWQAMKAVTYLSAAREDIFLLLTDDDRMADFDDMVDYVQVLFR